MGQVYYISKCSLKIANKQYTSLKNDYEMTLNGESTIIPCEDSCDVPMMQCDFVSISDLENKDKDAVVGKEQKCNTDISGSNLPLNPQTNVIVSNIILFPVFQGSATLTAYKEMTHYPVQKSLMHSPEIKSAKATQSPQT